MSVFQFYSLIPLCKNIAPDLSVSPSLSRYAILNECNNLVQSGVLSAEDVDVIMKDGLGYRYAWMGALETAHLNAQGK